MTLKQLMMFTAVYRTGSFSRAAAELCVAQPALSRQILKLEEKLGAVLFDRAERPVAPTAAGKLVFERSEQLLDDVKRLKADVSSMIASSGPELTIGFVGSALVGKLPAWLRGMREAVPNIKLSLLEMTSHEQVKALKEGRINVGFGRLSNDDPMIVQVIINEDRLVVALPLQHELAKRKTPLSLIDLVNDVIILYPRQPRPSYADYILTQLRHRGVRPLHLLEVADLHSALGLVSAASGISLVPESVSGTRLDEIHYAEIAEDPIISPVIMNHRRNDTSPLLATLLKILTANSSSMRNYPS